MKQTKQRVTGLGGIFFKARDPEKLCAWDKEHLGLPIDDLWCGWSFHWRDARNPKKKGSTVWSAFNSDTKYFGRGRQTLMLSYRVASLRKLLAQLKRKGCGWIRRRRNPNSASSAGSRTARATGSNCGSRRRGADYFRGSRR